MNLSVSLFLISTSLMVSCKKKPESSKEQKPGNKNIVIEVEFSSPPSKAALRYSPLKYGKKAALNIEWDDNSLAGIEALPLLNKKVYTDGCGNNISYTAALAINGLSNNNNKELGDHYQGKVSYHQMLTLIKAGWDIENHGDYHNKNGTFGNGDNILKNIKDLNERLFEKTGYLMNTFVVPNADSGYVAAAEQLGFLCSTTQGAKDGYVIYPEYGGLTELNSVPEGYIQFNRSFTDDWTTGYVNANLKPYIDRLLSLSSSSSNFLFRLGSHSIESAGFQLFINYIEQQANDELWVTSMRELMEYRVVKEKISKTEALSNNMLKITLDYDKIPDSLRFRDISFYIDTESNIKSIKISGADRSTYNQDQKLINILF